MNSCNRLFGRLRAFFVPIKKLLCGKLRKTQTAVVTEAKYNKSLVGRLTANNKYHFPRGKKKFIFDCRQKKSECKTEVFSLYPIRDHRTTMLTIKTILFS